MTTVAYRQGVMVGDRRVTEDSLVAFEMRKVFKRRSDGALIGGVGNTTILQRYAEWFLDGERGFKPGLGATKDDETCFIVARPNGRVEYHDRNGIQPILGKFFAIGSGASAALGALEMGATARQAVRVASKYDVNTGNGFHAVELP